MEPISPVIVDAELISDTEELGCGDELDDPKDTSTEEGIPITAQNTQPQGKRCCSPSSEPQDDTSQYYSEVQVKEGTQSRSVRIRKRPKLPAGFEIDIL